MSTSAAKAQANRANAQRSTGPRTRAGKAATSRNALKFGLFSTKNCVLPHEQDEYNEVCAELWTSLNPVGPLEELHATEVVRCAWRLRRCAQAESGLPVLVRHESTKTFHPPVPLDRMLDPMLYSEACAVQAAIDRARSQAQSAMRRALADLRDLQTERHLRAEVLTPGHDRDHFGLASLRDVLDGMTHHARAKLHTAKANTLEINNRIIAQAMELPPNRPEPVPERSAKPATPRNANCPCGSGRKHKRCCGQNAPPVLSMAA